MSIESVLKELQPHLGKEVFVSGWKQVTQAQINQFADSTGDHQWIHVDAEKAAAGPFGRTIAHGFLTLSHIPFSYQAPVKIEGAKMSINYGLTRCVFSTPFLRDRKSATGSCCPAWKKSRATVF